MTFTVDTHHHILPDFFWSATEGDDPVGGIAPALVTSGHTGVSR